MNNDNSFIHNILDKAENELCKYLDDNQSRFPSYKKLLNKFYNRKEIWFTNGIKLNKEITETINEICIAKVILSEPRWECSILEYEEKIPNTDQTIDYSVYLDNGNKIYMDIKTIHPLTKDDWGKFEFIKNRGLFPDNVHMMLFKDGLGGEIWHNRYNSRESMLSYTLEIENKILNIEKNSKEKFAVTFCSNGWDWRLDWLEDFADYYRSGYHNPDDSLMKMEKYDILKRNIKFQGVIDYFCYFERKFECITDYKFICKVKGPWG